MHIALCIDNNYAMQCGVLIKSILLTTKSDIIFHIFSLTIEDKNKSFLEEIIKGTNKKIIFHKISTSEIEHLPIRQGEHVSLATYYRLLLPYILPSDIRKILYLDCDMVVVDSLEKLWDINIDNFSSGVVIDMFNDDIRRYNRLDYPPLSGYFNAGTMLINIDYWRENNISEKTISYLTNYPDKCVFHDQDALNNILHGTYKHISVRYNFLVDFFGNLDMLLIDKKYHKDIEESLKEPCIIHFTGSTKPWHKECRHPYRELWRTIQCKTPWKKPILFHEHHGFRLYKYYLGSLLRKLNILNGTGYYTTDVSETVNTIYKRITR